MTAELLGYSYVARAQILALQGSFEAAESSVNSAAGVAKEHGFENNWLTPWSSTQGSAEGLILEREGRINEAAATYERVGQYGCAALLALNRGDRPYAVRLLAREPLYGADAHFAQGVLYERAGEVSGALREYRAAWAFIVDSSSSKAPALPAQFLEAPQVRAALARLDAPVP